MASEVSLIANELQTKCPLCKGVGMKEGMRFSETSQLRMGSCHTCKGRGWLWALDQEEMADRIVRTITDLATLRTIAGEMREALVNMCVIGSPRREDWLNDRAYEDARKICKEANAALARFAEYERKV